MSNNANEQNLNTDTSEQSVKDHEMTQTIPANQTTPNSQPSAERTQIITESQQQTPIFAAGQNMGAPNLAHLGAHNAPTNNVDENSKKTSIEGKAIALIAAIALVGSAIGGYAGASLASN
ncbi:MAG: hypothetical protein Q3961_00425, partial [Bifidobacteriaceae bacterium]|nr:hypothetical protein [Bifidobacteriaceae bacterium]